MRILIEILDTAGVEGRRSAFDSMNDVTLGKQQLTEICAVLTGYASDQGSFLVFDQRFILQTSRPRANSVVDPPLPSTPTRASRRCATRLSPDRASVPQDICNRISLRSTLLNVTAASLSASSFTHHGATISGQTSSHRQCIEPAEPAENIGPAPLPNFSGNTAPRTRVAPDAIVPL
jgi:hypothetical protein